MYGNLWRSGCELSVSEESCDMKINFFHPHGPFASYIYPATPDILWPPQSAILPSQSERMRKCVCVSA
jgi:hypothetical protein